MNTLHGHIALVTGAGSVVGQALACALAAPKGLRCAWWAGPQKRRKLRRVESTLPGSPHVATPPISHTMTRYRNSWSGCIAGGKPSTS
jgi:NAD(P)-dependent dehydrogenase (short-subunit alcohol dehydrogenase family)